MAIVTLTGRIEVPAADLDAVLAELPRHIDLTRYEAGCLSFEVEADANEPTVFHVHERFADPAAFAAHQARVRSSEWGAVAANAMRHYEVTGLPD